MELSEIAKELRVEDHYKCISEEFGYWARKIIFIHYRFSTSIAGFCVHDWVMRAQREASVRIVRRLLLHYSVSTRFLS